jgi:predicted RNase H-like HicB family nuclease
MSTYTAVIHREKNIFVAECSELGVVSQGDSMDSAIENLKEATEIYLEEFPEQKPSQTFITTFTMVHA